MAKTEKARLDGKGRIVIPQSYREMLRLRENSELFISLDEENARLVVSPAHEKGLMLFVITMSDKPGTLAKVAGVLAGYNVDLISTESRSLTRTKEAEWRIVCNASKVRSMGSLKKDLKSAGATSFSSKPI